jgi:hypothetical protein
MPLPCQADGGRGAWCGRWSETAQAPSLAATGQATVLTDAVLRLEGITELTFDSGSDRNVWANTGTGGSALDAKDRATGATGSVTQETYTLEDGVTTAKRMVFNGSTSGFQTAYQANQLANLTAYVVMSKDTGGSAGYQNLWSFDNGDGGYSRGMGYNLDLSPTKLQAQTKNASALTLADSSSVNQVWGLSYAGRDPQTINAYHNDSVTSTSRAVTVNNNGALDIGYVFLTAGNLQNSQFFAGSMSALLLWDRQLAAGERLEVETYLTNTYVVPEPTSIAFLAAGGLAAGVVAAARRRRRTGADS